MNSNFTVKGCLWGIGLWLTVFMMIGIGIVTVFATGDGIESMLFTLIGLVGPIFGGLAISRWFSDYDNGKLPDNQALWVQKIKRLIWAYMVSFVLLQIIFDDFSFINGVNETFTQVVSPAIISILLVLIIPVLYSKIVQLIANRKNGQRIQKNWFRDKVAAPILVSVCTGTITYLITGEYQVTSGVTLVSIPISWFVKVNINLEA